MRLKKNSFIYKIASVIRFYFAKIYYLSHLKLSGPGMLGTNTYLFISFKGNISLGKKPIIADFVELQSEGNLKIGNYCTINRYSRIIAFESINIGNNVTIAQNVSILDHDHNYLLHDENLVLNGYNTSPITIGNNVWLSDKCTVLRGVTIGNNVIAGAHTLINKDVPSNCIIGGMPFKILKELK